VEDPESQAWAQHAKALARQGADQDGGCVDDPEAQAWLAHAKAMQDAASPSGGQASERRAVPKHGDEPKPANSKHDPEVDAHASEAEGSESDSDSEGGESSSSDGESSSSDGEGGEWEEAQVRKEVDREEVVDSDVQYELDAEVFVGLTAPPRVGQSVVVRPGNLRWTHDRIQRLFSCGRSTRDVAAKLASGEVPVDDIPSIEVVYYNGNWHTRNNRRLWCLKQALIPSVRATVGRADRYFLRGFSTNNNGASVGFFPPVVCTYCQVEFVNRNALHCHYCTGANASALSWNDEGSEASSEVGSEDGAYAEDGAWFSCREWNIFLQSDDGWSKESWGRSTLWRAAATGNLALLSMLVEKGGKIDEKDCEGVTPMLAAVRRGQWRTAELLVRKGAFQMPWKWTIKKGKKWSPLKARTFQTLISAVKKHQPFCLPKHKIRTPEQIAKAGNMNKKGKKNKAEKKAKQANQAAHKAARGRKKYNKLHKA